MSLDHTPIDVTRLLTPRSVAVIGATEDLGKFGGRLMKVLTMHGFAGTIYPINRSRDAIFGLKAYPSVLDTPEAPDMVIMAVPQAVVKTAVQECADAGVKVAIILTSRFADAGAEGAAAEAEIVGIARQAGMRIIGPNCLGLISPVQRLALCASPALATETLPTGRIGMVSQSGALMTTMFDRAAARGIGFSHCFSIGNQSDMDMADFIDFLAADPDTDVICTYIEGLSDARRFLDAVSRARVVGKTVLCVKAGRTKAGAAAAFSHTASLAGSHEAFVAACQRAGIVLMDDTDAMVLLAAILSHQNAEVDDTVTVLTTSGGGGAIAADRVSDASLNMTVISSDMAAGLESFYEADAARSNPVDMGISRSGDWEQTARDSAQLLLSTPRTGFLLATLTTSPDITRIAHGVVEGAERAAASGVRQPFLIVLQPGAVADPARQMLRNRQIFFTDSLDEAIRAISAWSAMRTLASATALMPERPQGIDQAAVDAIGLRGQVDEARAKKVLAAYGVPVNRGELAGDAASATAAARMMQGPFVVKVVSPDIVHKSDVGGVALSLQTPEAVGEAVETMRQRLAQVVPEARIEGFLVQEMFKGEAEILIGARYDAQFGPQVMVGAGGILVELLRDVQTAAAPIDQTMARQMIGRLQVAKLLNGYRGNDPLDVAALADALSRISWLVHDMGERIAELDVNPVLVGREGRGCRAVDARILMNDVQSGEPVCLT